jgi:hypothetical protein
MQALAKIAKDDIYEDSKGKEKGLWDLYLWWIRPYSCCKHGGVKQDAKGNGTFDMGAWWKSQRGDLRAWSSVLRAVLCHVIHNRVCGGVVRLARVAEE